MRVTDVADLQALAPGDQVLFRDRTGTRAITARNIPASFVIAPDGALELIEHRDSVFPDRNQPPPLQRSRHTMPNLIDADELLERLSQPLTRAAPDTTSGDISGVGVRGRPLATIQWPTVSGLAAYCPLVRIDNGQALSMALLDPAAPVASESQALEKGGLTGTVVSLTLSTGDLSTRVAYTDLSAQAGREQGVREAVLAALDAAACAGANTALLAAIDTAATAASSTGLQAAVSEAAAAWGPALVIVAPIGTEGLNASGLPVIVDPTATSAYVIPAGAVSGLVAGPYRMEQDAPALLGTDLASAVDLLGPSIATGSIITVT